MPVAPRAASRRSSFVAVLAFVTLLPACRGTAGPVPAGPAAAGTAAGPAIPARVAPDFPAEWPHRPGAMPVTAPNGMVSSNERRASEAGVEILRRGGNAVDAAVAVGFALAVTYPEAGNLGGGGYMVIRMADGRTAALDYREVAPLAATRDMFVGPDGTLTDRSVVGHLASGVPGAVAGMLAAHQRYGSRPLAEVMAPAIRLADGFVVDSTLSRSVAADASLIGRFAGASLFLPGGEVIAPGSRLVQADLARTLRAIASRGTDGFYGGWVADSIAAEMRRGGGIITTRDLARYTPVWREPVRSTYRGYALLSMPPSSSGGITVTETLNILETFPRLPPFGSAEYLHLLASAYQRAFIDRNEKLADPAFAQVPVAQLASKEYARRLAATIDVGRATPTRRLEEAMRSIREGNETTHYSVVDRFGNAVATTTTINGLYGSGVWVRGAGFFMNNEMDDFAAQPGSPNQFGLVQGEANAVQPGKRMLSAMSPTIVLDPSGALLLVVGGRGGPRIITATSQVIINVIDHRMTLADAMSAPRIHHQARPDSIRVEVGGFTPAVRGALAAMGHHLYSPSASIGSTRGIMRTTGGWQGFVDPRTTGGAVGY